MRSMVEGSHVSASCLDPANNRIQIHQHVPRSHPQHPKAGTPQQRIPRSIFSGLVTESMLLSIHFDDQATF
jgi:hypothetical protein